MADAPFENLRAAGGVMRLKRSLLARKIVATRVCNSRCFLRSARSRRLSLRAFRKRSPRSSNTKSAECGAASCPTKLLAPALRAATGSAAFGLSDRPRNRLRYRALTAFICCSLTSGHGLQCARPSPQYGPCYCAVFRRSRWPETGVRLSRLQGVAPVTTGGTQGRSRSSIHTGA